MKHLIKILVIAGWCFCFFSLTKCCISGYESSVEKYRIKKNQEIEEFRIEAESDLQKYKIRFDN